MFAVSPDNAADSVSKRLCLAIMFQVGQVFIVSSVLNGCISFIESDIGSIGLVWLPLRQKVASTNDSIKDINTCMKWDGNKTAGGLWVITEDFGW